MKDTILDSSIFQEQDHRQLDETMKVGLLWLDDKHWIVYDNSHLFNFSPVGTTLSGFYYGKLQALNERFCNIVEYTSGELAGKH
ncbi:MAG: hypothetical protein ACOCX9_01640 [Spirochaetota bacterium]